MYPSVSTFLMDVTVLSITKALPDAQMQCLQCFRATGLLSVYFHHLLRHLQFNADFISTSSFIHSPTFWSGLSPSLVCTIAISRLQAAHSAVGRLEP